MNRYEFMNKPKTLELTIAAKAYNFFVPQKFRAPLNKMEIPLVVEQPALPRAYTSRYTWLMEADREMISGMKTAYWLSKQQNYVSMSGIYIGADWAVGPGWAQGNIGIREAINMQPQATITGNAVAFGLASHAEGAGAIATFPRTNE